MCYSVSTISHENTFLSNFVSFLKILLKILISLSTISKSILFFSYFFKIVFLNFILHLISSFIHGRSLSSIVMILFLTFDFTSFLDLDQIVYINHENIEDKTLTNLKTLQ